MVETWDCLLIFLTMAIVCEEIPFSWFPSTYTAVKPLTLIHSLCFVSLMALDSTSTGRSVTIGLPKNIT